jgi:hypothetical protein
MSHITVRISCWLIVCALVSCYQTGVKAQMRPNNSARRIAYPGINRQGRFIGFVPKHSKGHVETARHVIQPLNRATISNQVQQAQYAEAEPSAEILDEAMEPGEPGMPEWAGSTTPAMLQPFQGEVNFDANLMGGPPRASRVWARAEYLHWWTRGMDVPALATTSPSGTQSSAAGVLGESGTTILFGGDSLTEDGRSGGRFKFGSWLDPNQCRGLEVDYLFLDGETESFTGSNSEFSVLARPFFNSRENAEDARRIAFPGEISGSLDIDVSTDFRAIGALVRVSTSQSYYRQVDFLLGYRFMELEDQIDIRENTRALSGPISGTTFELRDQFDSENQFHGGELGVSIACPSSVCWSWEAVLKLALGSTQSRSSVFGQTTTTVASGSSTTTQAGLLTQASNVGEYEQSNFSAIPEFNFNLRRQLHGGLSATVGYTIIYWDVSRAGDQVDRDINPTQIPPGTLIGRARPEFMFETTDFVAQGLSLGIEYLY